VSTPSPEELQAQIAALQAQLAALQGSTDAQQTGSGAIAQDHGVAAGSHGAAIGGSVTGPVSVDDHSITTYVRGDLIVVGEAPVRMDAVARESALGRYLEHVISRNRYLQLQGIRSGGKLVNIELDRIYVRLRGMQQRTVVREEEWLAEASALAPGEARCAAGARPTVVTETVTISVEEALAAHQRLVVLGDPGSGKTTLVRYLALLYARDLAEQNSRLVQEKLLSAESPRLPILLPLRQIGAFLRAATDDGTEGHARLLEFLLRSLRNERITVPEDFFDERLTHGRAVILLEGLDEVADPDLRRRVARLVESFTRAYPDCRYVVTSRIVGYTGSARLGEDYATTTVQDFTLADVEQFLSAWHRLVAVGQFGPGEDAQTYAAGQTRQLLEAIKANDRIRELAINPLMLTVIALVHRDRVKLPDRRAELYAEAVDVLLGKWEEAKGVQESPILPDGESFDTGDKRLLLQAVALHMHEQKVKEISVDKLRQLLHRMFMDIVFDDRRAGQAVERFLHMIEERTGLLIARGEGVYSFSHLTFQEYLAALAVADRNDYIAYTLKRSADPWWREVILLEAGSLSIQGKDRATRLIKALAEKLQEPQPYHNLVLAAECLRDVGSGRIGGSLEQDIQRRLRRELETPRSLLSRVFGSTQTKGWIERRSAAMDALVHAGGGYWTLPYGEPEWVMVPAGEFWMGSEAGETNERPQHKLHLDDFHIARTPITNAQYYIFVQAAGCAAPDHWQDGRPPKGYEGHPVVNVTWHDAMAYCRWLSGVTGKSVTLPSEAQWEKAARGNKDKRIYPWGDPFDAAKCNCLKLGIGDTTPVGIFPEGASPYACLDMAGNVWEWTRSLWGTDFDKPQYGYPYDTADGRERLNAHNSVLRVLRGGSFFSNVRDVRCAYRFRPVVFFRIGSVGFRVVLPPSPSDR
jgi:formylglycine-generating enzyme required for sulfatase activity/energy-coupling factor transporter ATP-binding protein EcfA2